MDSKLKFAAKKKKSAALVFSSPVASIPPNELHDNNWQSNNTLFFSTETKENIASVFQTQLVYLKR